MPNLTRPLLRHPGRRPQVNPGPFQEVLPLSLRNKVTGKGREKPVPCLPEMMAVFSCFERNNFNESLCGKEISAFQKCGDLHREKVHSYKTNPHRKEPIPGQSLDDMSVDQLNTILQRYPQPK